MNDKIARHRAVLVLRNGHFFAALTRPCNRDVTAQRPLPVFCAPL
jgi:hypothetical protein